MRTTQPIQATSGGDYGDRKAQEEALGAMPLENAAGVQNQAAASTPPPPGIEPGQMGAFDRPTEFPDEPLTTPPMQALNNEDPSLVNLKTYLPYLELMTTMPDSSQTTRNFIRRLRGTIG